MSEYPHILGLGIMPAKAGPHNTNILTYVGRTEKLSSGQVNRGNPFENRFVVMCCCCFYILYYVVEIIVY